MDFSQEEKIKIQIENNNCIISNLNCNKTNSNNSTNTNTKTSSLKKIQKNLSNELDNELSLSISETSENDCSKNKNDISMLEITDKSIFNSEAKNGSMIKKTPETKKKYVKEKKIKKIKEAVVRKLNFDLPKNSNIDNTKIKIEKKYPLFSKIILDYQHNPKEKIFKKSKRITKKIKINLNFKEINLHKNNSFKENKNNFKDKSESINDANYLNNFINMNKKKNISYNNLFNFSSQINSNLNSGEKLDINLKNIQKYIEKEKNNKKRKGLRKKLSLSINNNESNSIENKLKKEKYLIINNLKRNSCHNFLKISTQKYNTYLTNSNNSIKLNSYNSFNINLKENINNIKQLVIKDKIGTKYLKTSNNSINHGLYLKTLSDNKNKDNFNNNFIKINYFFTYNFNKPIKASTTRGSNISNKMKILSKISKVFGKELYNPIKSNHEKEKIMKYNIKNNLLYLNNRNDNELKKKEFYKNNGRKISFSVLK